MILNYREQPLCLLGVIESQYSQQPVYNSLLILHVEVYFKYPGFKKKNDSLFFNSAVH